MKFEYMTFKTQEFFESTRRLDSILDDFGIDGWELVSVIKYDREFQTFAFFFKRAIA